MWLSQRETLIAVATVLALAGGTAVAAPALAEPSGCGHSSNFYATKASGNRYLMTAESWGSCNTSAYRTLRVEIKQDLSGQPDPLVAANSDSRTGTSYYAVVSSCDNRNTRVYYGRGFYTQSATYIDTPHYSVSAC